MKNLIYLLSLAIIFITACSKEDTKVIIAEKWEFTNIINANLNNNGYIQTLDIYQKKGNEWRILQFEPDDFVTFNLKNIKTPSQYELPVTNENAFITSNVRLFDPTSSQVHFPDRFRWYAGEPVGFNSSYDFNVAYPDLPNAWKSLSKITAATYSYENAYDNNGKVDTYIFYDFPNQKYLYYGIKTGADLILENTLPLLCTTCNNIDWKNVDAVTNTGGYANNENLYYFFDFDAQKMYVLERINKNTNHASFNFDVGLSIDFKDAFFDKYGTNGGDELPFDFSK